MTALALAGLTAACVPPAPVAPAPVALRTTKTPAEVVQIAARELSTAGFDIAVSDAAAGVVTARRVRSPDAQSGDVRCKYARGSIAAGTAQAALVENIVAQPDSGGARVTLSSKVTVDFSKMPSMFSQQPSNDTDCVSSGAVEKRVADAIR